jgi:cytoskeletal protein RodZ
MKTVGTILKEARLARGISLEEVEVGTKIRARFLDAIERDDFRVLPSLAYAKGFVKNYSEFLGLASADVMAFFRRQTQDPSKASLLPKGVSAPLNATGIHLTPTRFIALLLAALVSIFLLYFGFQYRSFIAPPPLAVEAPADQFITSQKRIDVVGQTHPDATITVNGRSVLVRSDGKFFEQVAIEAGVNTITIVATSRLGKTTTVVREVGLQP